jgi:hypothetical protein
MGYPRAFPEIVKDGCRRDNQLITNRTQWHATSSAAEISFADLATTRQLVYCSDRILEIRIARMLYYDIRLEIAADDEDIRYTRQPG